MKATKQLKAEHEGIKLMLGVVGNICWKIEEGQKPVVRDLEQIVEFLQVFADKCHHGKEEDILFPALIEAGMPKDSGPIAVMLAEHEQGRGFIRGLADAVRRYGAGEAAAGAAISKNARAYIALLALHIQKENEVLFPMADERLGAQKQDELLERFERLEVERIGAGKHEEFHRLLERLEKDYLG